MTRPALSKHTSSVKCDDRQAQNHPQKSKKKIQTHPSAIFKTNIFVKSFNAESPGVFIEGIKFISFENRV